MTPDTPDEDDRTVIRPAGTAGNVTTGWGAAPAPPAAVDMGAPDEDDRTVIRPTSGPTSGQTTSPTNRPTAPLGAAAWQTPPPSSTLGGDRTAFQPAAPAPPAPDRSDAAGNGLPVGTMLAEFELTQYIAEGGFGIVYAAHDHSLHRRVALKEYMPSSLAARGDGSQVSVKSERHRETFEAGRKSFVNEARLLASFDHPSLLKVYRFWEANGTAYMVMPFLEGITLKDRLRELGQPPDEAWLLTMLGPLTEALAVIHREQCYHRDIAPDNIMLLAGSNRALLMDFGASRRVIGDMTQALTVILKPGYAPVEQYAEIPGMKQGAWTDVYALAAVMYYAIQGKTPPTSVGRLLNDTYVPLAQAAAGRYSPAFLAAIDHALAVKPEERTQSIEQLRTELGLIGYSAPPSSVPMTTHAPAASSSAGNAAAAPARKNTVMLAAAAAAVLAVLGIGAYSLLAPSSAPSSAPSPAPSAAAKPAGPVAPTATAVQAAAAPVAADSSVTTAPAAVRSAGFDIADEFDRVALAQTPGFSVQAQADKSQLRIDQDELHFTVQSAREGFLYVQVYGSDGALLLLYPNATSGTVKLRPGQPLKLPKSPLVFLTSEPPGPTRLLVMVSALERDFSSLQPRKEGPYRVLPSGEDAKRIAAALPPSKVPAQAGKPICPATGSCSDEFGATVIRVDAVR